MIGVSQAIQDLMSERDPEFDLGWYAGQYAEAYQGGQPRFDDHEARVLFRSPSYRYGFLLGFFATYESHEIEDTAVRQRVIEARGRAA